MTKPEILTLETAEERARAWLANLRAAGLRVTEARKAVVQTLVRAQHSLTPAEVQSRGSQWHAQLGLVTVYRTLEQLEELGLVQRVHHNEDCQAYLAVQAGHNHLLICETCGRAELFEGDELGELAAQLEKQSGYSIHDHMLEFFGRCPDCARKAA